MRLLGWVLLGLLQGCASVSIAPYQAQTVDVDLQPVAIARVDSVDPRANELTVRGRQLLAGTDGATYVAYLDQALYEQLTASGLYDEQSSLRLTGELLKNQYDQRSQQASLQISMNFVLIQDGEILFEEVHQGVARWPAGFDDLEQARQSYPKVVANMLRNLLNDRQFQRALTR